MKYLLICIMIIGTFLMVIGNVQSATIIVPTNQPTLSAAIAASASGDTILINPGTYVNDSAVVILNKSLTIKGNGTRPVITLASSIIQASDTAANGAGIQVQMDSTYNATVMNVNFENLTILPAAEDTTATRAAYGILVRTPGFVLGTPTTLNLTVKDCLITSNNGSNLPVSTDGLLPASLTGANSFRTYGINGSGVINATLTHVIATHINSSGTAGGAATAGGVTIGGIAGGNYTFLVNGGSVFSYNGRFGLAFGASGNNYSVLGTPTTRNLLLNNGVTSVHTELYWSPGVATTVSGVTAGYGVVTYTDVISAKQCGIGFYQSTNDYLNGMAFNISNCRFVTATTTPGGYGYPGNLPGIIFTDSRPASIGVCTVSNCTFLSRQTTNSGIRIYKNGTADNVTQIVVKDCIFAQDSTTPTGSVGIANGNSSATPKTQGIINVTYSDLALAGPNALGLATTSYAGSINLGTGVIFTAPSFQSENSADLPISISPAIAGGQPGTSQTLTGNGGKYLNVTNAAFATADSSGGPLKGGAGFVSGGNYLTWTSSSSSIASLTSSANNTANFYFGPTTGSAVLTVTSVDGQAATIVATVSPTSVDRWMLFDIKE